MTAPYSEEDEEVADIYDMFVNLKDDLEDLLTVSTFITTPSG